MNYANGSAPDPYLMLPEHMRGGMRQYIEYGLPAGTFLRCVLENDLMGALSHADDFNKYALYEYGVFLFNYAPARCFGSPENYADWVARQGMKDQEKEVHRA